jgi:hypothetical protein
MSQNTIVIKLFKEVILSMYGMIILVGSSILSRIVIGYVPFPTSNK